jgi:hypothetical protein
LLALAFCVAASAFATSFDTQNSRNAKASFLPAGADWFTGSATVVSGGGRTSTLEQFFWNRGAKRLALLPGVQEPDVFAATRTHVTRDGRLAGVTGQVVLSEDSGALVPVSPERLNGSWLSARTPRLGASIAGRYGDGWMAPSLIARLFGGSVTFKVVAPESMRMTIGTSVVHLRAHAPVRFTLAGCGTLPVHFSSFGWAGMRAVSARSTFPVWNARGGCGAPHIVRP